MRGGIGRGEEFSRAMTDGPRRITVRSCATPFLWGRLPRLHVVRRRRLRHRFARSPLWGACRRAAATAPRNNATTVAVPIPLCFALLTTLHTRPLHSLSLS